MPKMNRWKKSTNKNKTLKLLKGVDRDSWRVKYTLWKEEEKGWRKEKRKRDRERGREYSEKKER